MNRTKALTLTISLLSAASLAGLAYAKVLPPNSSALLMAVVAGAYGLVRALQKIKDGASIKGLLQTTEAWGAILTNVAAVATSAAGVVSPKIAVAAGVIATGATYLSRALQQGSLPPPSTTVLLLIATIGAFSGCHNVTPTQAVADVVDCAKINPETSAAAAAVMGCVSDVAAGDPTGCLDDLIASARWTAAEVTCVAAYVANQAPTVGPTPKLAAARWLSVRRTVTANLFPSSGTTAR